MSTIVALGAGGASGHVADWSRLLADQAHERGHRLVVVDRPENLVGASIADDSRHEVVAADYADLAGVRAALAGRPAPDAVIGFREFSLQTAAQLAADAGTAWNGPDQIALCRAKDRTRAALRAAGISQPSVRVFESIEPALAFLGTARLPVIVKPRDAFGSQGVRLVESPSAIAAAVAAAFQFSSAILVEDFVRGEEFSVEGILLRGEPHILDVTRKTTTAPPVFVELGHRQPSRLPAPHDAAVRDVVCRAVRAVGLTHSLFHVEVWITADGDVVCGEVHARLGGDWIHRLLMHRRPGLSLFGPVIDDVLGDPGAELAPLLEPRAAAVVAIVAPHAGRVASLRRPAAVASAQVLAEDWSVGVGDSIAGPSDSFGRAGLIVVGAESDLDLDAAVRHVRSDVRVEVDP
ncbi:hypothetical protein GCM10027062_35170 [Nocardioides hungaricus]